MAIETVNMDMFLLRDLKKRWKGLRTCLYGEGAGRVWESGNTCLSTLEDEVRHKGFLFRGPSETAMYLSEALHRYYLLHFVQGNPSVGLHNFWHCLESGIHSPLPETTDFHIALAILHFYPVAVLARISKAFPRQSTSLRPKPKELPMPCEALHTLLDPLYKDLWLLNKLVTWWQRFAKGSIDFYAYVIKLRAEERLLKKIRTLSLPLHTSFVKAGEL